MYEVEQKYPAEDFERIVVALQDKNAEQLAEVEQVDVYFAHPSRDFAATDEAFRIRTVGEQSYITYKGPKLDRTTKTRRELEMPLAADPSSGTQFEQILLALGFSRVAAVRKRRRAYRLQQGATAVEVALDDVAEVGRYVELEVACADGDDPEASGGQLEVARDVLQQLAGQFKLTDPERRSYLELLLAARNG